MKKLLSLLSVLFSISIGFGQKSDTKESYLNKNINYYDNGEKWSEGNYKEGKIDGLYTFYYKNGQKSYEENYKDGIKVGLWTGWDQNGQKSSERFYKNGKVEGLENYWYQSGREYRELTYSNNELISSKEWNEDGSVKE